ncbi:MFS transporter [Chengkuizengella sp. SCS-71B]|uniref:MFS transporter n=1 Tax=Chengkuizengella sp. SCS-71B TaxID=3115290 RepID=UPI0032C22DF1
MPRWKTNLIVLWFGQFMATSGMSMIIPFLPLYIQELGISDPNEIAIWTSIIFAGNFLTSFLFQPLWGKLGDRYGRKIMILRSGFGMSIVVTLMGFATNTWQLLFLRLLNGTISGYIPASTSLVSTNTPREHIGFAMGMMQSGAVAGTILGPFIGGLLANFVPFQTIFFITGGLLCIASLLALFLVKEKFDKKKAANKTNISVLQGFKDLRKVPQIPALFSVTFIIQFSLLSVMPLMAIFVQGMHGNSEWLAFYVGLVSSITGFSNMIASPILGRLSDRIGSEKILFIALLGAALTSFPQAFVNNVWQLLVLRFFMGIFIGGLLPSVNSLLRKFIPEGMESRAYGFNTSALALGNMLGPITGGFIAGFITIPGLFIMSSVLLSLNMIWVRKTLIAPKSKNSCE